MNDKINGRIIIKRARQHNLKNINVEIPNLIIQLDSEMRKAADSLDFESVIKIREHMKRLQARIGLP